MTNYLATLGTWTAGSLAISGALGIPLGDLLIGLVPFTFGIWAGEYGQWESA